MLSADVYLHFRHGLCQARSPRPTIRPLLVLRRCHAVLVLCDLQGHYDRPCRCHVFAGWRHCQRGQDCCSGHSWTRRRLCSGSHRRGDCFCDRHTASRLHRRLHSPTCHRSLHDRIGYQYCCRPGSRIDGYRRLQHPRSHLQGIYQHPKAHWPLEPQCGYRHSGSLHALCMALPMQHGSSQATSTCKDVFLHLNSADSDRHPAVHHDQLARQHASSRKAQVLNLG